MPRLSALLLLLATQAAPAADASIDVRRATVLSQPGATATELYAAQELRAELSQIVGIQIPLEANATELKPNAIVVGQGPLASKLLPTANWAGLNPEQTLIKSVGANLVVAGGGDRGTMYAVFRLLQTQAGVRWWTPWAKTEPKNPRLRFGNLDLSETPAFEYREPYWNHTFDGDWAVHNFSNGASIRVDSSKGGKVTYQGFVHTYYPLVPPEKYFASHPEWYSLFNGARTHDDAQLCTTNPALRDLMVEQVKAELRANPDARIVSVSQNDCYRPCQCDVCRALVKQEGSEAALVLDLANYVADHIKDDFPNVAVDTLAYQWSRHPVKSMRPRPNVIVRLCSIECDFSHPLSDPANAAFGDDIRGWSKLTNRLYVWDYCTNFAHYLQPQPDYFALGPTLRFSSENGVKGVFEEGDYTSTAGDMAELKAWLIAQMLWDPKQDPNKLIDEFLRGYFGPAAKPIRAYLELMTKAAQTTVPPTHVGFALTNKAKFLNFETLNAARKIWDQAKAAVAGKPEFEPRVALAALSPESVWLDHWDEFRLAAKAANQPWPVDENRADFAARWLKAAQNPGIPGYAPVTAIDEGGRPPTTLARGS
jgi:hypothetical protein